MRCELELARELIRTRSPSGRERPAAELLCSAFRQLDFDDAFIDAAGNAVGVIRRGSGPVVMLNGHLDTVPAGDEAEWRHGPWSADISDGELWGRGAVDMKAAVAAMTLAAADAASRDFSGTLLVAGVVQEEVGGLGSRYLAGQHDPDVIILGEPSNLELKLGHRGRVEIEATFSGVIAHAARASLGVNALHAAAEFLVALGQLELPGGGPLGGSSAVPTRLATFPDGRNVVPGRAGLIIDYRSIPGDTPEMILERLQRLAPAATFKVSSDEAVSENGQISMSWPNICAPYLLDPEHQAARTARQVLGRILPEAGFGFREGVWWFATDAPYLAAGGAPVLGFGPGDPELAHTTRERVPVAHLAAARRAYTELALAFL